MPPVQPLPPLEPATPVHGPLGNPMGNMSMDNMSMGSTPMDQMSSMNQMGQSNPMSGAPNLAPNGMPMVQQVQVAVPPKKDTAGLVKTVVIVILSLIAVTFIGLFIWIMVEYNYEKDSVNEQIDNAVNIAKDEQFTADNQRFAEQEKNPYKTFSGPADYGKLTFEYPKTWSVYIQNAATTGGNFNAYFNPVQVNAVGRDTINALRVTISTTSYDEVIADYQRILERRNSNLTVQSVEIGDAEKGTTVTANRYTGTIPETDLNGIIIVFKIRDKTVILQTDNMLFQKDFDTLLGTITFNA